MGGVIRAHLFGRRRRGDREEVTMRLYDAQGNPLVLGGGEGSVGPEGPQGEPGPPGPAGDAGAAWVTAQQTNQQGPLSTGPQNLGPALNFSAGVNGLMLIHASLQAWHPPSQFQVDLTLDGGSANAKTLGAVAVNQTGPTMFSMGKDGLATSGFQTSETQNLAQAGIMMVLSTGEHKLQFTTNSVNAGGMVQRIVLAAMALG